MAITSFASPFGVVFFYTHIKTLFTHQNKQASKLGLSLSFNLHFFNTLKQKFPLTRESLFTNHATY